MSTSVVKHGRSNDLQRYLCKSCKHKFYDNGNSFVKMRNPSHIVVTALNLYFNGLSTVKVAEQINEIYGEKVSQVTIWTWIQKYSKLVSGYVKTLEPKLSGKYHHDETEIKVGGKGRYFWETLDEDTRFIVAHLLTKSRTSQDASRVFQQSLDTTPAEAAGINIKGWNQLIEQAQIHRTKQEEIQLAEIVTK